MAKNSIGGRMNRESYRVENKIYDKEVAALGEEAKHRGEKYLAKNPEMLVYDEERRLGLRAESLKIAENTKGGPSVEVVTGVRRRVRPPSSSSLEA